MERPVRIVLVGLGNLGCRFTELLALKAGYLESRYGIRFLLVGAADSRGAARAPSGLDLEVVAQIKREGETIGSYPEAGRMGLTAVDVVRSIQADVLCEASPVNLAQGGEPGLSCVRSALERGMHVVTPNKGPIVLAYRELVDLAREKGVALRFDGTVAGGLPALYLGARDLRGAEITRLEAVPNLVTGFLLDRLAAGASWEEALDEARAGGQLESDPTWDLDGWDAAAKLVILSNAVLDFPARLEDVRREGIGAISAKDVQEEARRHRTIRLVALAERLSGGAYSLSVGPRSLSLEHPLGRLGSHGMGIVYTSDLFGMIAATIEETTPLPSAATLLRDLLDITLPGGRSSAV